MGGYGNMSLTWQDDSIEVFSTASGTISFKDDDVLKVFIDWGDGVNQSLKDGVNQWTSLPKAGGNIDITHVYTKTGSFAPVIRTINNNGFVSKYYGSSTTNAYLAPYETVGSKIPPITVSDGAPTGVLKIENKTVLSGIDNNIFNEGPKQVYMYIPPITDTTQPDQQMTVTVTAKVAVPSLSGSTETGYSLQLQDLTRTFVLGDGTSQPVNRIHDDTVDIAEIVKMKMNFVKLPEASGATVVQSDAFNKMKIFLIAQGNNDLWYPITYVSNGDPIKQANDSRRLVTLDFTESRAKAANASSSTFNVDEGKFSWQPSNQWQPGTTSAALSGNTITRDKTIDLGYTYYARANGLMGEGISANNYAISGNKVTAFVTGNAAIPQGTNSMVQDQFLLNDFNQFVDTYHLARMTVTSDTGNDSTLQTFDGLYAVDPPKGAVGREAYFFNDYNTTLSNTWFYGTRTYANLLATNTHGYDSLMSSGTQILTDFGSYNLSKSGTKGAPVWTNDYPREAPQYLLFTNDKKVNKIFFNNTTYASKMMSNLANQSGATVAGVSYLRVYNKRNGNTFTQKAEWVPLQFTDTTRVERKYRNSSSATYIDKSSSFAKSGYITFDMPSDWETLSLSGMSGGFFDVTGATDATSSISGSNSNNPWSVYVTGMAIAPAISGTGDQFATYKFNDIGYPGNNTWYTDEDYGNYNYMFEVSSSAGGSAKNKATFWIASSSVGYSSGATAISRTLYLTSGANHEYLGLNNGYLKGFIRRINFYEVFNGASKTSSSGSLPNQDYAVTQDPTQYPYTFAWGGDGGDLSYYKQQWEGEKYALKIILSGAGGLETQNPLVPGAEMWTALPYNDNNSQVIIQKDNTAYDLSYMPINSDVSVNYAGTFYQAATKGGNVYIIRTGTPIQTIGLSSKAMGTEQSFAWSDNFTTFGTLEKLRDAQAEGTRVMWDEKQKDATWVRFFGVITSVSETHSVNGPRAPRDFTADMTVEEICLIDAGGVLISDIVPLGGVADARSFF